MSSKQIILISSIAMFIIAGAVALFFLDPTKHAFFPKCAFHMATGYSCPGCGSSRALFANTWLVIGLVVGMVVYAVLRNLPWVPFISLAP